MNLRKLSAELALVLLCAVILAACHSGSSTNAPTTPVVSRGVISKSGVIANGVAFDVSGAQITYNDSPGIAAQLQEGVTVKIKGRLNSDGVTGIAEKIVAASDIAGPIAAKGSDSMTVLGQQIFVDGRTVFANTSFPELAVGQYLEVFGRKDQQDRFLATRIELQVFESLCGVGSDNIERCLPPPPPDNHLAGTVEAIVSPGNPPFLSFKIGGRTVDTDPAQTILPAGATISVGDSVRLLSISETFSSLSGTVITAGIIERVDLQYAEFEPQENEQFEVEGFVSGFTALNADFNVDGVVTHLTGTAGFEGGISADLTNNVMVEAKGQFSNGVLAADKIKFIN